MKKKINLGVLLIIFLIFLGLIFLSLKAVEEKQELRKKAAGTGEVKFTLNPSSGEKTRGEEFNIDIQLETQREGLKLSIAGVELSYDVSVFEVLSLDCNSQNFATTLVRNLQQPGKIALTCANSVRVEEAPNFQINQKVSLGTFKVKVKNEASLGNTTISFTRTEFPFSSSAEELPADISDQGTPATFTIIPQQGTQPTSTSTPTPTSTPTSTFPVTPTSPPSSSEGNILLKMRIKFFGINEKKPNQKVRLRIGKGNQILYEVSDLEMTADSSGVYQNLLPLTLPREIIPQERYYFLIKGPKHLQAKFCQNSGQKKPCTTENIILQDGLNILDFTEYPLLGGDLPPQDGVVNALDAVNLVNCLTSFDPTKECVANTDLNLDGVINAIDIVIMNNTIYTRWEEE